MIWNCFHARCWWFQIIPDNTFNADLQGLLVKRSKAGFITITIVESQIGGFITLPLSHMLKNVSFPSNNWSARFTEWVDFDNFLYLSLLSILFFTCTGCQLFFGSLLPSSTTSLLYLFTRIIIVLCFLIGFKFFMTSTATRNPCLRSTRFTLRFSDYWM